MVVFVSGLTHRGTLTGWGLDRSLLSVGCYGMGRRLLRKGVLRIRWLTGPGSGLI